MSYVVVFFQTALVSCWSVSLAVLYVACTHWIIDLLLPAFASYCVHIVDYVAICGLFFKTIFSVFKHIFTVFWHCVWHFIAVYYFILLSFLCTMFMTSIYRCHILCYLFAATSFGQLSLQCFSVWIDGGYELPVNCACTGWHIKCGTYTFYVDQVMGHFWKRFISIIAVKGWTLCSSFQCDHPSLPWSWLIVSETVWLLNLHRLCMFHFLCTTW